jgi:nucleoside-diphosphate-sugar epimerase
MLHAAAKGEPYACFVRPDTAIPFMAMPDAVTALLKCAAAPRESLSRLVYNVTAFSLTAEQVRELTLQAFPNAQITYQPDLKRQGIVDSWPADTDDTAAHQDWGWQPEYDINRCFHDYLIPNITLRYRGT